MWVGSDRAKSRANLALMEARSNRRIQRVDELNARGGWPCASDKIAQLNMIMRCHCPEFLRIEVIAF